MTFEFEDGIFGDVRVNSCCHDFLGAVLGCGSENTCHQTINNFIVIFLHSVPKYNTKENMKLNCSAI